VREADVLCISSSKGLYGFDASLLGEKLSRPGHPVRAYNLSFGFGESFHYPMKVIKALDLRDKVLIADLTDNTLDWHLSDMGQLARKCPGRFDACKVVWEKWLTYQRDRLLAGTLPRIVYSREKGLHTVPYVYTGQNFRKVRTGDLTERLARRPRWARPGQYPSYPFFYDQLREPFFEECRQRNIRIVFTSVPYEGYDPEWGRRIAEGLGYPYVAVDHEGIELRDRYHMTTKGRALFSRRLAEQLAEE
jgi:hypothetical protein